MKKIEFAISILLFLSASNSGTKKCKKKSGSLTDTHDSPLPGANIFIAELNFSILNNDSVMYYFRAIYPENSSLQKIIT